MSDICRQIGGVHLPQRAGIHEVCVPRYDFAERYFIATLGIVAKQLDVGFFVHSPIKQPPDRKSDKVFQIHRPDGPEE
ncbi:MAG TPA: hypothetical protein VMJ12_06095 [Candidatus Acidoferrales bacterium]|nr:hypothetical protein [Candidatus Acidoferrales bacterium]